MEQEVFKDMLRKKGLKVTNQRMLVLEIMAERPGEHLTAEDIYDLAKKKCPEIGLATIYRTVQVLVDLSVIDKVSFDDGFARYELGGLESESRHHHHHAICSRCGRVFSFEGDLLDTPPGRLYRHIGGRSSSGEDPHHTDADRGRNIFCPGQPGPVQQL